MSSPNADFATHRSSIDPLMSMGRRPVHGVWWLALWLAVVGNLPLWQRITDIATQPAQRALLLLVMGGLVLGATAALLSLLA